MLYAFLLTVPSMAGSHGSTTTVSDAAPCSTKNSHPETGGYYIVGFGYKDIKASEDPNDPSSYVMQKADDYTWKIPGEDDTPYPDAQPKLCTSRYGCASDYNVMAHHTCSILRFAWAADVDSSVWKMKDNATFQACDFTGATKIDELDDTLPGGEKYAEFPFEQDSINEIHYFASKIGCTDGQKVAVLITTDYADTYDACYGMGTETSRIQHCDCDHSLNTYTMAEVCGAGLHDGCMSEMPDDLSCCPDPQDVTYASQAYTNGGNCIAKSQMKGMIEGAKVTYEMCEKTDANKAECDAFLTGDCPWWRVYSHGGWTYNTLTDGDDGHCPDTQLRYGGRGVKVEDIPANYGCDGDASEYTPTCDMWFTVRACDTLEAGDTVPEEITASSCGSSKTVAAYNKYKSDAATWEAWLVSTPAPTNAPTAEPTPKPTPTPTPATDTTAEPVEPNFATYASIGLILAALS
jgi:hypothetical protein